MTLIPDPTIRTSERRLSLDLSILAEELGHSEVRLLDVVNRFEGRVYTLLLVLLSLPFCQPIALPGISAPFGLIISLLGLRFALRKKPWIPEFILNLKIKPGFFTLVLKIGSSMLHRIEKLLHPRWDILFRTSLTQILAGIAIFISGFLLLLPIPVVPFTNTLPALAVILIAAAMAERDGLTLILGLITFLLTVAFFILLFWGGVEFTNWLLDWVREYFEIKA